MSLAQNPLSFSRRWFSDSITLQVGQRHLLLAAVVIVPEQKAPRFDARRVVLHVDGDGAARLGAASDVVELEAHQRLDERRFAVSLMADHEDGGRIEGLVELLRHVVQLRVRLVQALVAAVEEAVGGAVGGHLIHRLGVEGNVPHHGRCGGRGAGIRRARERTAHGLVRLRVAELLEHGRRDGVHLVEIEGWRARVSEGKGGSCERKTRRVGFGYFFSESETRGGIFRHPPRRVARDVEVARGTNLGVRGRVSAGGAAGAVVVAEIARVRDVVLVRVAEIDGTSRVDGTGGRGGMISAGTLAGLRQPALGLRGGRGHCCPVLLDSRARVGAAR